MLCERDRITNRHAIYLRDRMQIEITDPQYLWWDWVFTKKFDTALTRYCKLLNQESEPVSNGCLMLGSLPRHQIKFAGRVLIAYRFMFAVSRVIPLSTKQIVRHDCNNSVCINPRHLLVGDQRQNAEDWVAEMAYGTRWELIPKGKTP